MHIDVTKDTGLGAILTIRIDGVLQHSFANSGGLVVDLSNAGSLHTGKLDFHLDGLVVRINGIVLEDVHGIDVGSTGGLGDSELASRGNSSGSGVELQAGDGDDVFAGVRIFGELSIIAVTKGQYDGTIVSAGSGNGGILTVGFVDDVVSILFEVNSVGHGEQFGLELTRGELHVQSGLTGESSNGIQRPTSVNVDSVDLRGDGSLSQLVKVEDFAIAATEPKGRT